MKSVDEADGSSGDVHLGAVGQFYSNPRLNMPKDQDFRYMPNVISSAIANAPPPDLLVDLLNKRNKVHHLDAETDEDMIPIFTHDVDNEPRNNKTLLNRRNWCSIRQFDPSLASPPSTPDSQAYEEEEMDGPRPEMGRRNTTAQSKPPLTTAGGFFARGRTDDLGSRTSMDSQRPPGMLRRTLSLTRADLVPGLLRSRSRSQQRRASQHNLQDYDDSPPLTPPLRAPSGLRRFFSRKGRDGPRRTRSGGINGYDSETSSDFDEDGEPEDAALTEPETGHGEYGPGASSDEDAEEYTTAPPLRATRTRAHRERTPNPHVGLRGGSGAPDDEDDGYFPPYQTTNKSSKVYPNNSRRMAPAPAPASPVVRAPSQPLSRSPQMGRPSPSIERALEEGVLTPSHEHAHVRSRSVNVNDHQETPAVPVTRGHSFKRRPTDPLSRSKSTRGALARPAPAPAPIDLQGGLDICLNVEVNPLDPSGITMPYRLLVPALMMGASGAPEQVPSQPRVAYNVQVTSKPRPKDSRSSGGASGLVRKLSLFGRR